ncbi:hypothetical protein [Spirosoma terrae]|uniref:Uncharacterized protein n=1 Tax=Spirosoma terrae TaxID=1968276 RepID=A0A6L9LFC6_9BACT|nr:hypothetical protein [Spirosoma terrae]NDU97198.1 hypothetical protein [Spirosoma terrae]
MMKTYVVHAMPAYVAAWTTQVMATALFLNVPSEFWAQVMAVFEIPEQIIVGTSPLIGATVSTLVEVLQRVYNQDKQRRRGKLDTEYHDPTAKYWPAKIFVGTMSGLFLMSWFAQAVLAVIPKAPEWTIGFIAGYAGYWFVSKKLPKLLESDVKKDQDHD